MKTVARFGGRRASPCFFSSSNSCGQRTVYLENKKGEICKWWKIDDRSLKLVHSSNNLFRHKHVKLQWIDSTFIKFDTWWAIYCRCEFNLFIGFIRHTWSTWPGEHTSSDGNIKVWNQWRKAKEINSLRIFFQVKFLIDSESHCGQTKRIYKLLPFTRKGLVFIILRIEKWLLFS